MNTVFMNSRNSKTSKSHVLIIKLVEKMVWGEKSIAVSNLSIYYIYMEKHKKFIQQQQI